MNGIIKMYETVYLGLGTNLGNRLDNLKNTIDALSIHFGKPILISSIYESEPWGFKSTDSFLNIVVSYRTKLKPIQTLEICLSIEKKLGRKPKKGKDYESRIIDIDILIFGDKTIKQINLTIPHPYIENRLFVLEPLLEICSDENIINKYLDFLNKLKIKEKIKKLNKTKPF